LKPTEAGATLTEDEPNCTAEAPSRFIPVMVTVDPAGAVIGATLVILGVTLNDVELDELDADDVTFIRPVVAPAGTATLMDVGLIMVKAPASIPLKKTLFTLVKFVPLSVTLVPDGPLVGVKFVSPSVVVTVKVVDVTKNDGELSGV